jgi:translation initiation factor 2 alpha subunit (eIF-2alpha)
MNYRMYEAMFPEEGMTVMVKANEITDTYVSVSLLEYNNIDGIILLSEVLGLRFSDMISSVVKVGYQFPAKVIHVEKYSPPPHFLVIVLEVPISVCDLKKAGYNQIV